jgi:hypothetical protein
MVDLRVPNAQKVPTVWPMPHLADSLTHFEGSRYYGKFDFCQGYWQLGLHPDSQECQSIGTPFGAFTPTRVLHGTTNATMHMQAIIESIIQDFKPHAEAWLDDVATHAKSEDEYLDALEQCFW